MQENLIDLLMLENLCPLSSVNLLLKAALNVECEKFTLYNSFIYVFYFILQASSPESEDS